MGACDFSNMVWSNKGVCDAYQRAVEAALYEHGHDPYNGTISTTSRPVDITAKLPRYGTKAFDKAVNALYSGKEVNGIKLEKWDCYAVRLRGKELKEFKARCFGPGSRKRGVGWYFFGLAGC